MCYLCEIKPVYEFTNQKKLCKTCFIHWFEKKFLYTIRKFKMIQKHDVIAYSKENGFRDVVLENLLNMFTEKAPVEIIEVGFKKKFNKKAIASTIDLESSEIINILFNKKFKGFEKLKPIDKKIIKPLYLFLDEEVLLYAKLKNLKFKKEKFKETKLIDFVKNLEKKHPEIKRGIVNSCLELYN